MPQFLLQRNGTPVGCSTCKRALSYPSINIPEGPPVYVQHSETVGQWKWNYLPYCVGCAKKILKRLKPADLEPVINAQDRPA